MIGEYNVAARAHAYTHIDASEVTTGQKLKVNIFWSQTLSIPLSPPRHAFEATPKQEREREREREKKVRPVVS